jgi:hypothetical protein
VVTLLTQQLSLLRFGVQTTITSAHTCNSQQQHWQLIHCLVPRSPDMQAYGRTTYLVTTFQRVPRGTEGAVSAEGTAAGMFAAFAFAGVALLMGQVCVTVCAMQELHVTSHCLVELGNTIPVTGWLHMSSLRHTALYREPMWPVAMSLNSSSSIVAELAWIGSTPAACA